MVDKKITEIENIRQNLTQHGLDLEIFATKQLRKYGWRVRNQYSYFDSETGKYRTTDIVASMGVQLKPLTIIRSIIECKRSLTPWLFFTSNVSNSTLEHTVQENAKLSEAFQRAIILASGGHRDLLLGDFSKDPEISNYLQRLYRDNWQWGVIPYEPFQGEGKSLILEASMQVIKASIYEKKMYKEAIRSAKKIISYRDIILPMIVFDGHLYSYTSEYGKEVIQEADSVLYNFNYQNPYLIQIVTKTGLIQFLEYFDKNLKFFKKA